MKETMTPTNSPYRVITCRDNYDLLTQEQKRIGGEWPEFMLHDPVAQGLTQCYEKLPDYQFVLVDAETEEVVCIANSIPLLWEGRLEDLPADGWDWALTKGLDDMACGRIPNLLCALQIVVFGGNRGKRISTHGVRAMKAIGRSHGLHGLIAPVRPNRKSDYPDTPIDEYIQLRDSNGFPQDPWMRVHARDGARIIKPCPTAVRITGTVTEWKKWTAMSFPHSGDYVVPGALVRVHIDRENDLGTYTEPNVWMWHHLS
jgi:hypothetical protein